MKVLFLTQILPYPPNAGPRVKTWHVLRHLALKGAEITLLTFIRPEEQEFIAEVRKIIPNVITVPIHRNRIQDVGYLVKAILKRQSFLVTRDDLQSMRNAVSSLCKEQVFDIVHADQLTMAQFAWQARQIQLHRNVPAPKIIFDAHNATWTIMERMRAQVPFFLRPLVSWEQAQIKRYEGWLVKNFDLTLAVTSIDRTALLDAGENEPRLSEKIKVIPIAVDTQQLAALTIPPQATHLLTLGTLHYPPNADGIRWFLNEVYPLILNEMPATPLTVIGKNPPKDFYEIAERYPGNLEITGYIADLAPYLAQTAIVVVPVLAGGGMRVRILEAFSRQLAVVTTTIGLEGIDATNGEHVLVADDPPAFAACVINLLRDSQQRIQLAQNGRRFVQENYDWQVVFRLLDQVYALGNSREN